MKKFLHVILLFLFLLTAGVPTVGAQTFGNPEFNFNTDFNEDIKTELEALKEVMVQLRSEMTLIISDMAKERKKTQEEMRLELENLRNKAQGVLSQITTVIKKEQQAINEDNQALVEELRGFKIQAETIKYELDAALNSTKLDAKKILNAMQTALEKSRRQATQDRIVIARMLNLTRKTTQADQKHQEKIIDQSRTEVLSSLNTTIQILENDQEQNKQETKATQEDIFEAIKNIENPKKDSATTKKSRAQTRFAKSVKSATETAEEEPPGTLTEIKNQGRTQLAADPLLIHKKKLTGFSDEVKKLKRELANGEKKTRPILIEVSKINLQSQSYFGALSSAVRLRLIQHADTAKIILGNFEMAVWALKSALRLNPADGDTHLLLADAFEKMHEGAEAIHHARMAEYWFQKKNKKKKAIEAKTIGQSIHKKFTGKPQLIAYTAAR